MAENTVAKGEESAAALQTSAKKRSEPTKDDAVSDINKPKVMKGP